MLGFLRDYILYIWSFLFKQSQPVSGALASSSETNRDSVQNKLDGGSDSQFQSTSLQPKEKPSKPEHQTPRVETPTPKPEPTLPVSPKPSPAPASDPAPSKPAPPPSPKPTSIPAVKPAPVPELKPTPPPVADVISTPPPSSAKPAAPEIKSIPPLTDKYDSDKVADDVLKSGLRLEETKSQPPKSSPKELSSSFAAAEATAENAYKPRVVQEVKREDFDDQEDIENEEPFDYGDELEDEEDEEQEYELQQRIQDHLRSIRRDQPPSQPNQAPKPPTELKYTKESFPRNIQDSGDNESDEEIIEDIDSLEDEDPEIATGKEPKK